jgi:acyl carrier protein
MKNMEKVIKIIEEVLKDNGINVSLSEDFGLIKELSIDSVIAIEILVAIENEFDITIDDADLSLGLLETPRVICDYINKKI